MKLSTRARYGLRALLDIALHGGKRPVLLSEIALRQGISKSYLEQIILSLQASGFIISIRGKGGGFILAKPPQEISLLEVVRALEGPISLVDCVENPSICPRKESCATTLLWQRLKEALERELEGLTLEDLTSWAKER